MKRKIYIYYTVAVMIAAGIAVSAQSRGKWYANNTSVHAMAVKSHMETDLQFLTDSICNGRASGTRGNSAAAFWITGKFSECNLLPFGNSYIRSFFAKEKTSGHNIIGMLPAAPGRSTNKYIIVGAHYDHIGQINGVMYPGADSNASGIIALTTVLKMMTWSETIGRIYDYNIIFVAFDAKELSMAGSTHLAQIIKSESLQDPITGKRITPKDIKYMVNIDQIGGTEPLIPTGRQDFMIMLGNDKLQEQDQQILSLCNRYYGTRLELHYTYFGSENFTNLFYNKLSDQKAFIEIGIPSVLFTSGITMRNNKPNDDAASIDMDILRRRTILIWEWLSMIA